MGYLFLAPGCFILTLAMRSLLLHTTNFEVAVIEPSTWPIGIKPETKQSATEKMTECLVCFFTVESGDTEKQLQAFKAEIEKTANEVGTKNLVISPFVHLSNNIAQPAEAKVFYEKLVAEFSDTDYHTITSHFGYHKSLLLDIKGHPGSFRYREFN